MTKRLACCPARRRPRRRPRPPRLGRGGLRRQERPDRVRPRRRRRPPRRGPHGQPASGLTANLSDDPATSDTAPDWSPDGTRIAFYRFLPGEGNRIFTVAPSGKALTQRTFGGPNDVHPAWSPDGTRIAFAGGDQDDGLPFHIHTVTLATGKTTQLTSGRVVDLLPSWQPL